MKGHSPIAAQCLAPYGGVTSTREQFTLRKMSSSTEILPDRRQASEHQILGLQKLEQEVGALSRFGLPNGARRPSAREGRRSRASTIYLVRTPSVLSPKYDLFRGQDTKER